MIVYAFKVVVYVGYSKIIIVKQIIEDISDDYTTLLYNYIAIALVCASFIKYLLNFFLHIYVCSWYIYCVISHVYIERTPSIHPFFTTTITHNIKTVIFIQYYVVLIYNVPIFAYKNFYSVLVIYSWYVLVYGVRLYVQGLIQCNILYDTISMIIEMRDIVSYVQLFVLLTYKRFAFFGYTILLELVIAFVRAGYGLVPKNTASGISEIQHIVVKNDIAVLDIVVWHIFYYFANIVIYFIYIYLIFWREVFLMLLTMDKLSFWNVELMIQTSPFMTSVCWHIYIKLCFIPLLRRFHLIIFLVYLHYFTSILPASRLYILH